MALNEINISKLISNIIKIVYKKVIVYFNINQLHILKL